MLTAGALRQTREVHPGGSYLSQSDPRAHFGLGEATGADSLEVRWPSGVVDRLSDLSADRHLVIEEGRGPRARRPLMRLAVSPAPRSCPFVALVALPAFAQDDAARPRAERARAAGGGTLDRGPVRVRGGPAPPSRPRRGPGPARPAAPGAGSTRSRTGPPRRGRAASGRSRAPGDRRRAASSRSPGRRGATPRARGPSRSPPGVGGHPARSGVLGAGPAREGGRATGARRGAGARLSAAPLPAGDHSEPPGRKGARGRRARARRRARPRQRGPALLPGPRPARPRSAIPRR